MILVLLAVKDKCGIYDFSVYSLACCIYDIFISIMFIMPDAFISQVMAYIAKSSRHYYFFGCPIFMEFHYMYCAHILVHNLI